MQSAQRPRPPRGEPRLPPPGTGRRAQARGSLQDSVFCGAGEVGVGSVLMEGVWVPTAGAARRQSESWAVSLVPSAPKAPLARGYIGSRGESTSGKKKVTKSYKRPGCAMSTWGLAGPGEVSEQDGRTSAQNPWLSVPGRWPAGASWTEPDCSREEPW